MENKLTIDNDFTPSPDADGDELYRNGIFMFNITRIIEYIQEGPDNFLLEEVAVESGKYLL